MRERLRGVGLLFLRLTTGWILATHGWGKVTDVSGFTGGLERAGYPMPEVLGQLAAWSEFAGGLCLILGVLTPLAALMTGGTMAVAAFYHHLWRGWGGWEEGADPSFLEKLASTRWEFALAILGASLCLLFLGAGRYSIDGWVLGRLRGEKAETPPVEEPAAAAAGQTLTASAMPLPDVGDENGDEDDDLSSLA